MLDLVFNVATLLIILLGVVIVHEFGHLLAARALGVTVHEFGLGLPPRVATLFHWRGMPVTLNALPIGAFVRLAGEDGDSLEPGSFGAASLPRRLIILYAGVALNLVLAALLFAVAAFVADPAAELRAGAYVDALGSPSPARLAGLTVGPAGDAVVAINGLTFAWVDGPNRLFEALHRLAGTPVSLSVRAADGTTREVSLVLRPADQAQYGALGLTGLTLAQGASINHSAAAALGLGVERLATNIGTIFSTIGKLVSGPAAESAQLAGPIGLASTVGEVRTNAPPIFLVFLAGILATNLAVFNALPLPPLDGGRAFLMMLRPLFGRRWSPRVEMGIYRWGMYALLALFVIVSFGDIRRLLGFG